MMKDIKTELVEYLKKCDDAYYNSSNPLVSDTTYDAMVETLRRLDPDHPYLSKVGANVKSSSKVGRVIPMGTLAKYHTDEDIMKWLESTRLLGEDYIILAPKYDGFAVELIYQDSVLVSAGTRGDGLVGENVLESVKKISNIPHELPYSSPISVVVRGEVLAPKSNHEALKSLGYTAMRNAVPGIVRANRDDALKYLDFIAYEFIDQTVGDTRGFQRDFYGSYFDVEDYQIFNTSEFEAIKSRRDLLREEDYPYELDGVVLKTLKVFEDNLLHPDHMVAWKYKSNLETTTLRDIEFNVGATGAISVVGVFDPVEFQGATLTRASFGSLDLYRKMHPRIGDLIEVSRRGDIIPWIENVVFENPEGEYLDIVSCPHCHNYLVDNKCVNKECPEIVRLKLTQFIKGIGVKGIGESLVRGLIEHGIVTKVPSVYYINPGSLLEIPRQGESSVKKWRNLQSTLLQPIELLTAYPFENVGKKLWETILSKFTYKEILDLTEEDLRNAKLKGIGDTKITSIISQIQDNREDLVELGAYHNLLY